MKNTTMFIGILVMIGLAGAFIFAGGDKGVTGKVIAEDPQALPGEMQKVVISQKDFNYYPAEIKVRANQPVEIRLDKSVGGCLRSFTIKELGVSKYLKSENDKLVFTPTKKGTYSFACSMGMGYGKIVVE